MFKQRSILVASLMLIVIFWIFTSVVLAEEVIELKPIVVIANRTEKPISLLTRDVIVIEKEEIKKATSITELLKYVNSVDLQERSPDNVQADLTIRGSTFSQTLILLNGMRLSDPQTAHHNLDLPLSLNDIERIEILKGNASSLWGSSAFGGVVNIITKKDNEDEKNIAISFGENNFLLRSLSIPFNTKKYKLNLNFDKKTQNGWRENTDSKTFTFSCSASINNYDIFLGLTDKDFGASYFYASPWDKNAREKTKVRFLSLVSDDKDKNTSFNVFSRWHTDRYVFDFTRPQRYINYHRKWTLGINTQVKNLYGVYGMEFLQETYNVDRIRNGVDIGKLGNFTDTKIALFGNYSKEMRKLNMNVGARLDLNDSLRGYFSPQISLSYQYLPSLRFRTSAGSAFRAPSFTELYYEDPGNIGNPDLKIEKSNQIEIGSDYNFLNNYSLSTTIFYRDEENIIDWIKKTQSDKWKAENFLSGKTQGAEASFKYKKGNKSVLLNYTYLSVDAKKKYQIFASKYKLRYPRHSANVKIGISAGLGIFITFQSSYKKRIGEGGYFISDMNLTKNIKNHNIFIKGKNLFNKRYEEIIGCQQPGRWITVGIMSKLL